MKKRVLLSWSSDKDSTWAQHVLRQKNEFDGGIDVLLDEVVARGGFVFVDLLSSAVGENTNAA